MYFTSVSTKSFSDELKLNSTVNRKVGSVSVYVNVLTNILKPYVVAVAYTDSGNGLYDLELFNRTINICMLFENKQYEPLLQVAYKLFKKEAGTAGIPTRCPIIKVFTNDCVLYFIIEYLSFVLKRLYSIKDAVINSETLPPIMPEKKVYVKFTFLSKDDTILKELGEHSGYIRIEKIRKN